MIVFLYIYFLFSEMNVYGIPFFFLAKKKGEKEVGKFRQLDRLAQIL